MNARPHAAQAGYVPNMAITSVANTFSVTICDSLVGLDLIFPRYGASGEPTPNTLSVLSERGGWAKQTSERASEERDRRRLVSIDVAAVGSTDRPTRRRRRGGTAAVRPAAPDIEDVSVGHDAELRP